MYKIKSDYQVTPPTREQHTARLEADLAENYASLDNALSNGNQASIDLWAGTIAARVDILVRLTGKTGLAGECYNYSQPTKMALLKVNPELYRKAERMAIDWREDWV